IEKKMWLTTYQDGFWDLYWGLLLLGFGISPVLENFGINKPINFIIFPILAFFVLFAGKKFITTPRMGIVKFGSKRKSDHKKLFVMGIITFIFTSVVLFLTKYSTINTTWKDSFAGLASPIGFALFFILTISVIAYFMEFRRLYFYAFLFGISILLAEALYFFVGEPLDGLIAFSATSLPILITGIVLFIKFIHKYKIETGGI
ncbi:hypothetical protein ACFLSX_00970, partial [Calditrichota bacterium]